MKMILLFMGVCGSGKSLIGESVARELNWQFYDADNFHSEGNKHKMSQGVALTDQDRIPWLVELHNLMHRLASLGEPGVVACSALKAEYRQILISGSSDNDSPVNSEGTTLADRVLFMYLYGTKDVLQARLRARQGHFMPAQLLDSQLQTLEPPCRPENFVSLDVARPPRDIVNDVVKMVQEREETGILND